MKRVLHTALLCLLLVFLGSPEYAHARKPRKKQTVSENVTRIRIVLDMAQMRDSVQAQCERFDREFYGYVDSSMRVGEIAICNAIDEITGFKTHRPGGTYLGELVVALAKEHLGKKYKWAANGPDVFDCSGFTRYIYNEIGISIPRHSGTQFEKGREISHLTELQEGDLVFFSDKHNPRRIGHVGIVVSVDYERGRYSFIHASASGVRISPNTEEYFFQRYMGAARYIPAGK